MRTILYIRPFIRDDQNRNVNNASTEGAILTIPFVLTDKEVSSF